jgi:hypothetical protein
MFCPPLLLVWHLAVAVMDKLPFAEGQIAFCCWMSYLSSPPPLICPAGVGQIAIYYSEPLIVLWCRIFGLSVQKGHLVSTI